MIDSFLQYLQYEKGYSSHTVLSYRGDLLQLSDYLSSKGETFDAQTLSTSQVREWMVWMMDSGMSVTTVHRKLSSLKSFYRYLNRQGVVSHNPTLKIIAPKMGERLPVIFQEKELDKLLEIEKDSVTFEQVRDSLIIDVFYQTGMRCSELVGMLDADVDTNSGILKVLGKRNKERLIPFGEELSTRLSEYRSVRAREVVVLCDNFFVLKSGRAMYPRKVYEVVRREMSLVSSQKKRGPHILRHTFATSMLNNGAELNAVKELLGHSSLAATQVYTHSTFEQLYTIYKQAHQKMAKKRRLYGNSNSSD